MPKSIKSGLLVPDRHLRILLIKWLVALLIPVSVFTFFWSGEAIENNVLLGIFSPKNSIFSDVSAITQGGIFCVIFYATLLALVGYLVAADDGRCGHYGRIELWADIIAYTVVPILLISWTNNLIIGLALSVIVIAIYLFLRRRVRDLVHYSPPPPLNNIQVFDEEQRMLLIMQARIGGFWFATIFAIISLVVNLIFFLLGSLVITLLIWIILRTLILPIAGYFLGWLGGIVAAQQTIKEGTNGTTNGGQLSLGR